MGAVSIMKKLAKEYELEPGLCGLRTENIAKESRLLNPKLYNLKATHLLGKYYYKHPNFFIIGEGRSHHEQSVVWIEDNKYKGYGYFEPENIENDIQSLKDSVVISSNSHEVHRLIRNWLRKKTRDEIINY
jgi:DNA polymerase-3 subunit epsilon